MFKIILGMVVSVLIACNTGPDSGKDSQKDSSTVKGYSWPVNEENEFLSGCVDSAKLKMDEAAAFAQCKCILKQLKQLYPSMDSAAPALMDIKRVAAFVENCK